MRKTLFEFYKPDEPELKKAWENGIFTFDANVLLNLYRYSPGTRKELFNILKHLQEKLWLSHQAGYEYLNNRLSVIHLQKVAYDEIKNILGKKMEELSNELNSYKKHSTIKADKIKASIKKSFEAIDHEIDGLSKSHPTYEPEDTIKDELAKLFETKTGKPFDKPRLFEIFKEGKLRYDEGTPPGFKDKSNKKDETELKLYGDLVLWKQIIEKGKEDMKPMILVTDDLKEDWWDKFKGETQGPRKELLREFFDETGQKIYIYQADKFLEYANKLKIGKTVKEEAIKEIRDVRIKDEDHLKISTNLNESINRILEQDYVKILGKFVGTDPFKFSPELRRKVQEIIENYNRLSYRIDSLTDEQRAQLKSPPKNEEQEGPQDSTDGDKPQE